MNKEDQVTKCPTCGSMLRMDYGMLDFPCVPNEVGTCTFIPVDARRVEAYEEALEFTSGQTVRSLGRTGRHVYCGGRYDALEYI